MGTYCKKGKSKPVNIKLYNRIKSSIKKKVKRWPSAYASGQVVRMYKQKGGKYRCSSMGKPRCSSMGKPRCTSNFFGKKVNKTFLYNPKNPKKSFDVYIDKNPNDTIHIKYKTIQNVKNTINKLEKLYKSKKYTHKRIKQVAMIMKVRLRVLKNKKPQQYALSKKYFDFLGKRTKLKLKRYKLKFKV